MVITSLSMIVGATQHVTAQVLDQFGNVMPGSVPTIIDSGADTSFAPDAGTAGAGILTALTVGSDTLAATFGSLTATLPIVVSAAPPPVSVPTSIQFTSP